MEDNSFDDIFENFMKDLNENVGEPNTDVYNVTSPNIIDFNSFIESMLNIDDMGEPNETEYIEIGGETYERSTWNTNGGELVRLKLANKLKPMPLEEQLKIALEEEDYQLAAKLRDEISKSQ